MNITTRSLRLTRTLLVAGVLGVAALTGCGGGDDDDGVASLNESSNSGDSSASADSEGQEQELLNYTRCLREQGLDVPDPEFDEDGEPRFMFRGEPGEGFTPEAFQRAREACGDPPALPGGASGLFEDSEFQDAALEFARCMREHGVDVPDPDFSQGPGAFFGPGPGGGNAFDPDDPTFQDAQEACQEIMDDLRNRVESNAG